jgi:nitroreductase
MNETIELMLKRRSVRTYTDKPVSAEDKQTLFDCAMRAPTGGNMMLYSMIEVSDQALKDRLVTTCDDQPFIAKAPFVVLFLADYQRLYDFYCAFGADKWAASQGKEFRKPEEGDFFLAINDALIAAQSMVTAAESLGIGSCYIGDIMENYEIHREMFNLPDYTFPITLLCFGYPRGDGPITPVPRFEEKYVRFENSYKSFETDELLHLYDRLEKWQHKGKVHEYAEGNIGCYQYQRKFASDYSIEMSRSVRAALEKWKS